MWSRALLRPDCLLPPQTGQLEPLLSGFTEEEEKQMTRMLQRMDVLAKAESLRWVQWGGGGGMSPEPQTNPLLSLTSKKATKTGVRLMVDAEQTYFQPAISRLTREMQRKFNVEKPLIFNTYQCYLRVWPLSPPRLAGDGTPPPEPHQGGRALSLRGRESPPGPNACCLLAPLWAPDPRQEC